MKKKYQLIKEIIKETNQDAMFLEPKFDTALIGTCLLYGGAVSAAYDPGVCIKILMKTEGMTDLEAFQKFQDTITSTKKLSNRPVFINDFRKIKPPEFDEIDPDWTLEEMN